MSVSVTAEARVRVTALPEMATLLTLRVVVPTVTVKAPVAGFEVVFRLELKIRVRVAPLTVALWNTGAALVGVLLVIILPEKLANSLPAASATGSLAGLV